MTAIKGTVLKHEIKKNIIQYSDDEDILDSSALSLIIVPQSDAKSNIK